MRKLIPLLLLVAATARAHDFWIEPSTFRPRVGENLSASLRVGQDFAGDPVPRSTQLIDAFIVREGKAERPVNGFENDEPAGILRLDHPGLAIIGYRSKPFPLELPAEKFEEFLHKEGFDQISASRRQRGESQKPDRERFYRYAKSFVLAGSGNDAGFDHVFGYRYELIPETSPHTSKRVVIRAVFEGKPLAGALVTAILQANPSVRFSARADRGGHVTFELSRGVWLVKSLQMVAAPAGSDYEWESLWASLTFER